jgi:hypothetical protein
MGRPLRKDVLGVDVIGTYTTTDTGVRVQFYDASLRTDGIIVKQRGAKTFVVTRVGDIGSPHLNSSTNTTTAVLKNGTPNAAGEMLLEGFIGGNGSTGTPIAKITKRVATDFNGVRYTWQLQNDSSNDYIQLTAI